MTLPASPPARSDRSPSAPLDSDDEARMERLRAANINPRTGLATDYLNHFNEAIMLLEMIPDMPECAEDFLTWRPKTYREHFEDSNLKAKDLMIQAYEEADLALRAEFDRVVSSMRDILLAVSEGMRSTRHDSSRIKLAA